MASVSETARPSEADQAWLFTAPGISAIAVVRLAGPGVVRFMERHIGRLIPLGRAVHTELWVDMSSQRMGATPLDDVIVFRLDTDQVELHLHGGAWVVRSVIEMLRRERFAIDSSLPLPLPNGAIDADDPLEREIEAHLPLARTEMALRVLLGQRQAWERVDATSFVPVALKKGGRSPLEWLLFPPVVAIIGPANAGKSTLANRLFGAERVITADLPGTTRDWVGDVANIDGLAVMLIDTPGLRGDTVIDDIESRALALSRRQIDAADLVLLVLDPTQPWNEQADLLRSHPQAMPVINKIDLSPAWPPSRVPGGLRLSAREDQNIDALRRAILDHFGCANLNPHTIYPFTARQRALLAEDS